LGLWLGIFEGLERSWLRWYDANGSWVPTPTEQQRQQKELAQQQTEEQRQQKELAQQQTELAQQQAELAQQQTELAQQRAELAQERAERLAERLRAMGIDPDEL